MQISLGQVINQLAVMMLIIAIGYIAKKIKILNENGDKVLSSLVVNITSPALIVISLSTSTGKEVFSNLYIIALCATGLIIFASTASKLMRHIKGITKEELVIYRFSVTFGNASFLGFPLCYGLFGNIGLLYASVYSAVQDAFFWSLGAGMMGGNSLKSRLKNLLNPNMIAILAGFALLVSGVKLPLFLNDTFSTVGNATVPLALIMVGSGFCNVKFNMGSLKDIMLPGALKLIIIPIIAGALLFAFDMEPILRIVLLLEMSMPTAASTVVLARNYNQDYILASKVVMFTTVMSMLTLPLLVLIAKLLS